LLKILVLKPKGRSYLRNISRFKFIVYSSEFIVEFETLNCKL
jgi:hypothetical protein